MFTLYLIQDQKEIFTLQLSNTSYSQYIHTSSGSLLLRGC